MQSLNPQALHREVSQLSCDFSRLIVELQSQIKNITLVKPRQVIIVGSGDSLYAGISTEQLIQDTTKIACRAIPSFEFISYNTIFSAETLVIVISASGTTLLAVQALKHANIIGLSTLTITTNANTAVCENADAMIIADLPNKEPCPGVRSYQAILLAIALLAIELGDLTKSNSAHLLTELAEIGASINQTISIMSPPLQNIAELNYLAPSWVIAGSGPNYGTARYVAAKFTEALGCTAIATYIDEWWHIERHLLSKNIPIILIAPDGATGLQALKIAEIATKMERRTYIFTGANNKIFSHLNNYVIPIKAFPSEIFSPLLLYIFAPILTFFIANLTSTKLFPARSQLDL